jgi:hypothetical protein
MQSSKAIEKITKPYTNIAKIIITKDPIEKRFSINHLDPLKSASSNFHYQTQQTAANPITLKRKPYSKKKTTLSEVIAL